MPHHLLEVDDLTSSDIFEILELAVSPKPNDLLSAKGVALLFEKPSNRTRNSMEMAITQLGGHPVTIRPDEVGIGQRESIGDIARTLSCYHEIIGARVFDHSTVTELAANANVPVINMLSDEAHPLQALADLLTISQEYTSFDGRIITYIGDANNVARSLAIGCGLTGMSFRIAHPEGYGFSDSDISKIQQSGTDLYITNEPKDAIKNADVVYTDVWTSMGQESERKKRLQDFKNFTVTDDLMHLASGTSIFLHCLPAHPGEEATRSVLDSTKSRIWKQAENRMHASRGLLMFLLQNGA